jgi:hypothetical protein
MKTLLIAASAAVAVTPFALPAAANAQSREVRQEQRECQRQLRKADSRREYNRELRECRREIAQAQRETRRDRRQAARDWRRYRNYDWDRNEPGRDRYDAARYYRNGGYYRTRTLAQNDRIYRGQNGRYYCRRNDGTTGLIVGAGLGALLGNQIDIGGSRTVNTIIGGAAGALLGRAIDKGSVRCD